jgi:hypothetical protein
VADTEQYEGGNDHGAREEECAAVSVVSHESGGGEGPDDDADTHRAFHPARCRRAESEELHGYEHEEDVNRADRECV